MASPPGIAVQAAETSIRRAMTGGVGGRYDQMLRAAETARSIDPKMFQEQFGGSAEQYADAVAMDDGAPWVGNRNGVQRK
jgi:hypothetical protein